MNEKIKSRVINSLKIVIFLFIVFGIAIVMSKYLTNSEFRSMIDNKVFKKEIKENMSNTIEIDSDGNPYLYTYDKYITVFNKNILTFYDKNATVLSKIDVILTEPYMIANGKNFVMAEKNGSKIYMISDMGIKWEKDVGGEIYRVSINENGYVSVLLKSTTYKSVVIVYDINGNELFKTYLAQNYAICSEISKNNKYLAVGEIDYSGTIVKSVIKIISMNLASSDPQNAILNVYESESGKILNNLQFNSKNEAICMFDTYIQKISDTQDNKVYDIDKNDVFVDINLNDDFVVISKETSGLFSYKYQMNIKDTIGKTDNLYLLEDYLPKKIKISKNNICMIFANEVKIVNEKGWLLKSYINNSEIQDVLVGENIIGIVYNNKIEIVNL